MADMICDDKRGYHWSRITKGNVVKDGWKSTDWGMWKNGWCGHATAVTQWADIDGDGKADILCND